MLLNIINLINTSFFKMSVKPYNSYKFNKPMFKSEYSNVTKTFNLYSEDPIEYNSEIVIPICEPTDIQGVRKFKNTTLQVYAEFSVSNDEMDFEAPSFPVPYFVIATEYYKFNPGTEQNYNEIHVNSSGENYFISTNYSDVSSAPTEILNKGTLLLQGQLSSKKALIQSTRLSKNLDASDCIYLILKIPEDPYFSYFHLKGLFGTINYSIKFS